MLRNSQKGLGLAHDYEVVSFCVDAYLRHVRSLGSAMDDLAAEIAEHESRLSIMGVSYEGHDGGHAQPTADKLPDGVIRLIELRERLSDEIAADMGTIEQARALCREDENRRALWMQKVDGLTYAQIAAATHTSTRTARRSVERGKWSLYLAMPEEWRRDPIPNAL